MKKIKVFISLFIVSLVFTFCTGNKNKENNGVYRVSVKNLYDYYDEHDDSLVCGLSVINKEVHYGEDNQSEFFLYFLIEDPVLYTGIPFHRELYLDEDEISQISIFLDSCLMGKIQNDGYWETKMKSGTTFSYCNHNKSVNFWCNQGYRLFLQITPQRLKEVLTEAMKDENSRSGD